MVQFDELSEPDLYAILTCPHGGPYSEEERIAAGIALVRKWEAAPKEYHWLVTFATLEGPYSYPEPVRKAAAEAINRIGLSVIEKLIEQGKYELLLQLGGPLHQQIRPEIATAAQIGVKAAGLNAVKQFAARQEYEWLFLMLNDLSLPVEVRHAACHAIEADTAKAIARLEEMRFESVLGKIAAGKYMGLSHEFQPLAQQAVERLQVQETERRGKLRPPPPVPKSPPSRSGIVVGRFLVSDGRVTDLDKPPEKSAGAGPGILPRPRRQRMAL